MIKIDKKFKLIRVAYCEFVKSGKNPVHNMKAEITGTTAIEIINTKFTPSVVNKKVSKSLDGLDWIGFFVFISIIL